MFCPKEKCKRYDTPKPGNKRCYYEPQCWKGKLDSLISIFIMKGGDKPNKQVNKSA